MTREELWPGLARVIALARINFRYIIYHANEWVNDSRYGIHTRTSLRGFQSLDGLRVLGDVSDANPYAPTPFGTIERILKHLPADTSQYTFIDYGSGKGRVLLMATRYRFREMIGIEFAEELHRIAERNISRFRGIRRSPVHSELCDATTFELPPGPCILYIFNSFGGLMMKQVAVNIIRSYLANPRHIMIVYYNPTVGNAFDVGGHFRHTQTIMEGILGGLGHRRRYTARVLEAF